MLEDRLDPVQPHALVEIDVRVGRKGRADDLADQQAPRHLLDQHEGQQEQHGVDEIAEERPVILLAEHQRPAHQIAAEKLDDGDADEGETLGAVRDEKRQRDPETIEPDEDVDGTDRADLAADEPEKKRNEGQKQEDAVGRKQKAAHVDPRRDQQRDEKQRQKDGGARRLGGRGRRGRGVGAGPAHGRRPPASAAYAVPAGRATRADAAPCVSPCCLTSVPFGRFQASDGYIRPSKRCKQGPRGRSAGSMSIHLIHDAS